MGEDKPRSVLPKLLAIAAVLVLIAVLALAFVPLQSCPNCAGSGRVEFVKSLPQTCPLCNGRGKTMRIKEWLKFGP